MNFFTTPVPFKTERLILKSISWSITCYSIPYRTRQSESPISRYVSRIPSLPNSIPSHSQQLSRKALIDLLFHGLNLAFQLFGGFFSCYRTFWAVCILGFGNVPLLDLGFVAYQACGFSCGACFSMILIGKNREYLAFMNLIFPPESSTRARKELQRSPTETDSYHILVQYLIPAVYVQSLCNSFLFIRRKNSVQYLWGMLPPNFKNWVSFGLITVYEGLISMNSWNIVLFLFLTYSSYTHYLGIHLRRWAKEEARNFSMKKKTSSHSSLDCIRGYRKLQIVEKLYDSCFTGIIVPIGQSYLLFLSSWMTFATLRMARSESVGLTQPLFLIFPLGTFAIFIIAFVLNYEGMSFYEGSSELLKQWRKNKIFVRFKVLQSLSPLKSRVGSLYYLKRLSPLIFMSNAVGLTINLLLTF